MTYQPPSPSGQAPSLAFPTLPQNSTTPLLNPAASAQAMTHIHAYFKHTDRGLKLDWEVFAQTKYRRLVRFVLDPQNDKPMTFRVLIARDPKGTSDQDSQGTCYLLSDPANREDMVRAICEPGSEAELPLGAINWVGIDGRKSVTRTATIELCWQGLPENRRLIISRFHCWEFLGLGGK